MASDASLEKAKTTKVAPPENAAEPTTTEKIAEELVEWG
ncbi:hypothetical protein PI124_g16229 [Phytophthora idaei]|nr:hypothetical protein PI125_g16250 [Phytophthora idaei]KAG3142649.1 hypothetical protein PI126_g14956 [Phytophthora idaei]KAG3238824.1 hypothetical protein PI124_g16229 [Phytophthora idaei]